MSKTKKIIRARNEIDVELCAFIADGHGIILKNLMLKKFKKKHFTALDNSQCEELIDLLKKELQSRHDSCFPEGCH